MTMKNVEESRVSDHGSEIQKFYNGKSVFITGAAGFLGKVLLEILLRCCPGIIRIYILLRPKNGLQVEDRKEKLFKSELFHKLIKENPDALNKVFIVPGDVSQDNLGMCEKDYHLIIKEVSIVFHVAASISFFRPISFVMKQNVVGTDNIIELCKKMDKLEALVYSSTLYSNSNRKNEIKEIVYKLPFKAEEAVQSTRIGNVDALNHLFSKCNPNFVNYYSFSKCVSENLLAEKAHELPVCIIRPSFITSCLKGALPGYVEEGSALVNLTLGVGKGFIRVVKVYDKKKFEFVPADIAANTHIVAAFLQATKSGKSPIVYNCTSAEQPYTWEDFLKLVEHLISTYPLPNSYFKPSIVICKNLYFYKFCILFYHFLPAIIIDTFLWISGKELRLLKLYKFLERIRNETEGFFKPHWDFMCENFVSLPEKLNETDAKIFTVDFKEFDIEKYVLSFYTGSPQYRINGKPYKDTLKASSLRFFLTFLYKSFQLGIVATLCLLLYLLHQVFMYIIS